MCGIFGVIGNRDSSIAPATLREALNILFKLSESRGREASGVALLCGDAIRVTKHPLAASVMIRSLDYQNLFKKAFCSGELHGSNGTGLGSVAAIGHSRLVTNGSQENHDNNQPVIKNGMVAVHNGIITNVDALWEQFSFLERQYEIDTEILLGLIRHFYNEKESMIDAVCEAFGRIEGCASLAVLFEDLNQVMLATNNGSLYMSSHPEQQLHFFASERYILSRFIAAQSGTGLNGSSAVHHVAPGTGCFVDLEDFCVTEFPLKSQESCPVLVRGQGALRSIKDIKPSRAAKGRVWRSSGVSGVAVPLSFEREFARMEKGIARLRRCKRCILPETMPFIEFDSDGVCNYCRSYRKIEHKGLEALQEKLAPLRSSDGEPDCLVAFSGGRDSSYAVHLVKNVLKMNPVTYTYDWGMVTDLARRNQMRICGKLGIEHILVSADINWKRGNIRRNVTAWLKKPVLGMVPLFMAGDKQYYYYANKVGEQTGCDLVVLAENMLEISKFKFGFGDVRPNFEEKNAHAIKLAAMFKMAYYYGRQYLANPGYINRSIFDTIDAYRCFFAIPKDYLNIYQFLEWDENTVNQTLLSEYNWEKATDTHSTWRIGDGTAPFYNYIYYTMAGFTENDTLRSNQIREGILLRENALEMVREENLPRYESIKWYCDTIGIDFQSAIETINAAPRLFPT